MAAPEPVPDSRTTKGRSRSVRWAAAANPTGPAPTTATGRSVIVMLLCGLRRRGRGGVAHHHVRGRREAGDARLVDPVVAGVADRLGQHEPHLGEDLQV